MRPRLLWALMLAAAPSFAEDPSAASPELFTVEDRGIRSGKNAVLSLHRLNYAIQGDEDFKLQYSFKLRVVDGSPFFFAYTNYMVWDTLRESIPVKDSDYNPELFWRFREYSRSFTVDAGYSHLSNGQPGEASRAVDALFARLHKPGVWRGRPWSLLFQAHGNLYLEQTDYDEFTGWWSLSFWLRNVLDQSRSGLDLQLERTAGPRGHPFRRGNVVAGVQYRLIKWDRFNPLLYVQWFHGYGEVLLDYNRFSDEVRAGLSWFY
jgi:phospholipase A1/A2